MEYSIYRRSDEEREKLGVRVFIVRLAPVKPQSHVQARRCSEPRWARLAVHFAQIRLPIALGGSNTCESFIVLIVDGITLWSWSPRNLTTWFVRKECLARSTRS